MHMHVGVGLGMGRNGICKAVTIGYKYIRVRLWVVQHCAGSQFLCVLQVRLSIEDEIIGNIPAVTAPYSVLRHLKNPKLFSINRCRIAGGEEIA